METLKKRKIFVAVWVACAILVLTVQVFVRDNSSFMGIAGSRAQEISTSVSAKIRDIHVMVGQTVKRGDLLVELENPELELEMHKIRMELDYLKDQKRLLSKMVDPKSIEDSRIVNLEKQLSVLKKQRADLLVFSDFDGRVESILRREGENSQPLMPILTLQDMSPTKVHGFIHESMLGEIAIGTRVEVTQMSPTGAGRAVGTVISFGTSIVPFPERLLRDISRPMWGREVVVELAPENRLMLGEKVFIAKLSTVNNFFNKAYADDVAPARRSASAAKEVVGKTFVLSKDKSFEASGLVWDAGMGRYFVVSDGKHTAKKPQLMLVDRAGAITRVHIPELGDVRDLESVSQDAQGNIIVMTSLRTNKKKDKNLLERTNMAKLRRDGMNFTLAETIPVAQALTAALERSTDATLKALKQGSQINIDVEGMAWDGSDLLMGLRTPLHGDRRAIILRLKNLSSYKTAPTSVSVELAYALALPYSGDEPLGISDLAICGRELFIAGAPSGKKGRQGAAFKLALGAPNGTAERLIDFTDRKPEGIECESVKNGLALTFDHGKSGSLFAIYENVR